MFVSLSANGLYKADCTTAPTPKSKSVMTPRNCVILFTRPFTSEPNDSSIKRGNIKPHITLTTCKTSDVMVFSANFLPLLLNISLLSYIR